MSLGRQSIEETVGSDEVGDAGSEGRSGEGNPRVDLREGARVGRYVVLERLGAGGMGVVHAALDPELDRRIALKLVRATATDSTSRPDRSGGGARLLREAQAIAKLRHPNVVVVHDVGSLGEHVFIAMEYLDGGTLRRWLDGGPRPWAAIVQRFRAAAEGLAAAHTAGIIHRDFKPENVLLGSDPNDPGGLGRVCVVDFGLARAVTGKPELDATTGEGPAVESLDSLGIRLTQTGGVVGTPAYMAPEQHAGEPTDERTDQFSFCVALYEALFGRRPFAGDTAASVAFHVMQGEVIAPPGGADVPRRIVRAVMRGLSNEPAARYPSMRALIDALTIDPRSRRKRVLLGLAVGGGIAVAGTATYLALAEPPVCAGAAEKMAEMWGPTQRVAVREAILAAGGEQATTTATSVVDDIDAYTRAWIAMHVEACEATEVRQEQSAELLDRRMTCLESRRRHVGTIATLITGGEAKLVRRSGDLVLSLAPVDRCGDVPELLAAHAPADIAIRERVLAAFAVIDEIKSLRTAARVRDAAARLESLSEEVTALDYTPLTAHHLYYRAAMALDQGRPADAERLGYEAAIACSAAKDYTMEATSWTALVRVIGINGRRFDEVVPLVKAAEAAIARVDAPAYWRAGLDTSVGTVEMLQGNLTEAERRLRAGRSQFIETMGAEHAQTLEATEMLALTLYSQERYDEAEAMYRELIEIHDRVSGPEHPSGASALANLGLVYAARGEDAAALDAYERAHARFVAAFGERHQVIATSLMNIASTLRRLGRLDESEAKVRQALDLDIALFGEQDTRVAAGYHQLGQLELTREQPARAIESHRRAIAIWEKLEGPTHHELGFPLTGIGEAELVLGHPTEAVAALERALAVRATAEGVPSDELAQTRFALAKALRASGGDDTRGRALASEARMALDPKQAAKLIAEIDAWLAASAPAPSKQR